jgi:hypothetical protein
MAEFDYHPFWKKGEDNERQRFRKRKINAYVQFRNLRLTGVISSCLQ